MSKNRCSYIVLVFSLSCIAITGATKRTRKSHRPKSDSCILISAPANQQTINRMSDQIEDATNEVDKLKKELNKETDRLQMMIFTLNKQLEELQKDKSKVVYEINSIKNLGRRNSVSLGSLNQKFETHHAENSAKTSVSPGEIETIQEEIQQTVQKQKEINTTVQQKEDKIRELTKELETCNKKVGSADNKASLATFTLAAGAVTYTGVKTWKKIVPKKLKKH